MEEVLLALAVITVATSTAVAASLLACVWHLRRRNRVHPRHRSAAPLSWLVSPAAAARAHRQLRSAVRLTCVGGGVSPALEAQAAQLGHHAVGLDAELVHVARLPRAHRRPRLRQLQERVVVVERTAVQLVDLSQRPAPPSGPSPADDLALLAERVGLISKARDELAAMSQPLAMSQPTLPADAGVHAHGAPAR
jgi:hypothetical protein